MRARMSPAEAAEVLGVPVDAPLEEVQHAYLRAARQVHPDVLPDASEPERADAASRFDALSQAREVLLEHRPPLPRTVPAGGPATAPPSPAYVYPAPPEYTRGRGLGGSLVVLALLVLMLLAIVSLQDAFRAGTAGGLDRQEPPVVTSTP